MILAVPTRRRACLSAVLTTVFVVSGATVARAENIPLISTRPDSTVGFDGTVHASIHVGDTVYLGGNFTHAIVDGKRVSRKRLAAVHARTGGLLPWAPPADDTVLAVASSGSSLYVTGEFSSIGGQPRAGIAGLDLKTGAVGPLRHTVKGTGRALATRGGRLYLGGEFTAVDGRPAKNLAAFHVPAGGVDPAFDARADGKVNALAVVESHARLYVGGGFTGIDGDRKASRLAALRLSDAGVDTGFRPGTPYPVFALTVAKDRVFAGLAGQGGRVTGYRRDGAVLWSSVTDGDVQAITQLDGAVYAGGHFTVACPKASRTATSWCPAKMRAQPKLAAWNPADGSLLDWNPRGNGKWGVLTMWANPALRSVTVGGDFTAVGSKDRSRFAQFRACGYGCGR
ncbi:hypothetical protein AB0G04_28985 [Actinoplanes sp. NPDC023801]|uniref:hypothetical protein n=1 Tax=Actinoplanes sp. NPDC023801 TaxID=3154595 RepID=UPI0034104BDB